MPKSKMSASLKSSGAKSLRRRQEPLWKGPLEDGITQSLLSRFLVCRERFRVTAIEGLRPAEGWNKHLGYGEMWHVCEEAYAGDGDWNGALLDYARAQAQTHRTQQEEIRKWYNVCKVQFPEYVKYWSRDKSRQADIKPLLQEQVFDVPYRLPSGRIVRLRGKWDSVFMTGAGRSGRIYLQENKTKGDIREGLIARQLTFDLQTMFYLTAMAVLRGYAKGDDGAPDTGHYILPPGEHVANLPWWDATIGGVLYNVVRRPLSGGKGSIKKREPNKSNPRGETDEEYYERLRRDYLAAEPQYWFMRWSVPITDADLSKFRREFLDPVLEQLWDWWDWMIGCDFDPWKTPSDTAMSGGVHYRFPFGVYNPITEAGCSDLDEYLDTGVKVGLERASTLFPELS